LFVFFLFFWVLLGIISLCLFGVPQMVVTKDSASATCGIRASQVHRGIVCRLQEH